MNLVDPSFELIDPNPDIHALFLDYNRRFFREALLACEVRCAGVCVYEGNSGMCSIRLSQPLLKLRPRSDLVETLLHEMIHAYLFVTANNRDREGHGPEFQSHMHRINKEAGTKITIFHSFHAEVRLYKTHHWRCDGPCRERKPFYGWVKRAMNRAPGPSDTWWTQHQATCGGTYHKVAEPEGYKAKKQPGDKEKPKKTDKSDSNKPKKTLDSWLSPTKKDDGQRLGEGGATDGKSKLLDQLENKTGGGTTLGGATTGRSRLLDLYDNQKKPSPKKKIDFEIVGLGSQFNPIQLDDDGGDRNDPNYQWQEGCGPMLPYEGSLEAWEQWPSDWPKESVTAEEWEAIPEGLLNQNTKSEEWEPIPPEVIANENDGWEKIPVEILKPVEHRRMEDDDYEEPQPKKKSPKRCRGYENEDGPDYEIVNCPHCGNEEYQFYMERHILSCTKK